jgi:DNA-directed RNA polymerase specialized sigma24 family protein
MTPELYQVARRQVARFATVLPADREDVIQETFLRLWQAGVQIEGDPAGFVYVAIRMTVRRRWQKEAQAAAGRNPEAPLPKGNKPSRRRLWDALSALLQDETTSPPAFSPRTFWEALPDADVPFVSALFLEDGSAEAAGRLLGMNKRQALARVAAVRPALEAARVAAEVG